MKMVGEVEQYNRFLDRLGAPQEKHLVATKPEKMVGETREQYRKRVREQEKAALRAAKEKSHG